MPKIRAEQLKDNSLMDLQIALNASIKQSKIAGQIDDPTGWISKGTVHVVDADPVWDGTQEGQIFYNDTTDELKIGVGMSPYFVLINNNGETNSKWESYTIVKIGSEGQDWDGQKSSVFVSDEAFDGDGSNLFVYLNGVLLQRDQDYTITNATTITLNGTVSAEEKITFLIYINTTLTNYSTKAYVENRVTNITADILPDMTGATGTVSTKNIGSDATYFDTVYANEIQLPTKKVVTVSSGAAFPVGPTLGDMCYRTDLDELYFYQGSTWIQI